MPNTKEITLFIALSVLAILFFIVVIAFIIVWSKRKFLEVEKKKQIELIRAIVQAEETQKAKIATDLHDQIIPILTLSALHLNAKIVEIENGGSDYAGAKDEVEKIAAIAESIREIAHGIIPKMFTSFGIIKSIETVVKQMNDISQATVRFENKTDFKSELPYSMVYQLSVYNATLEILNNLRKHSKYKSLTVSLKKNSEFFNFVFTHDGIGVTNNEIKKIAEEGKGIGLVSLQSRIIALDGEIDYKKEIGVSIVSLKFPIKNENSN